MELTEPEPNREDAWRWIDGTQLLAIVLERLSNGAPVTITKKDVERAKFGTTHPVVFTIGETEAGKEYVVLTVPRHEN